MTSAAPATPVPTGQLVALGLVAWVISIFIGYEAIKGLENL